VKRVFILDDAAQFLPLYLRFMRGVIDSDGLALNVSRELLQKDPEVDAIRGGLTKRVLDMLDKLAADADATLSEARATIGRVDRILAAAPIDDTVSKLDSAATRLDKLLANPSLERTVDNVGEISDRLRKLADSGDLDRLVRRIAEAADRLDALIGDNQYDVRVMVQDLRTTANNLRVLSENIKRYPAGALVGGPPDKVQLPARSQ